MVYERDFLVLMCLLISATSTSLAQLTCPRSFVQYTPNYCGRMGSPHNHFCAAAEQCADYGKRDRFISFLTGRNYSEIQDIITMKGMFGWIGLVRLLLPTVGDMENGWRDADPRNPAYVINTNEFVWDTEPTESFALVRGRKLFANQGSFSMGIDAICEYGGPEPRGVRLQKFSRTFPANFETIFSGTNDYPSCEFHTKTTTRIECFYSCSVYIHCRSAYFNTAHRTCVHAQFVDNMLMMKYKPKVGTLNNWIRMAKTNFGTH